MERNHSKDIRKDPSPLFDLKLEASPTHSLMVHRRIVCNKSKLLNMLLLREQELVGPNEIVHTLRIQLPIEDGEENEESLIEELVKYFDQCIDLMYDQNIEMSTHVVRMAMFLMMDADRVLKRWAKGLSETLNSSDLQLIKGLIDDESIGYSNKTIRCLISYYGNQITKECSIPQQVLDELIIYGDFHSTEKLNEEVVGFSRNRDSVKVIRSEFVNIGLVSRGGYQKFSAFGVDWLLKRFNLSFNEELLKIYVDDDFEISETLVSPLNIRVYFILYSKYERVCVDLSNIEQIESIEKYKASYQAKHYSRNGMCTCFENLKGCAKVSVYLEEIDDNE
ncbi:predicted protein [Naegleria gruberi]|uniref:Predicted protein n=1 Tax=Naegleria gruberi TaxID=5762 RepID=D2V483_NAEGR|nr:uncharacterized protein NAEGRDRAFT_63631 [Naegleria gruberi]EFC48338.1 predicted protein [Naegleria gruberi]|eukprot:XP_002681082.1 predicted protein [Naegleria gruberi strain NEG-M]